MPKTSTSPALTLPPREGGVTAHRWLCGALRSAVLDGRLRPGTRLPATREIARSYGLARGTVVLAFEQLRSEGYLEARVGSGTYVARVLDHPRPKPARGTSSPAVTKRTAPALSGFGRRVRAFDDVTPGPVTAFRTNRPALDLFPTTAWARVVSRNARRAESQILLGCGPAGYQPLREVVADYLTRSRGAACSMDQVIIVSGVQEALDLTARLFVDPGNRVAVEDPGYFGATRIFESAGASIVPIPVDHEGFTLSASLLENVKLAYVTPAHQFPVGVNMSVGRRLALLEWAASTGALIFEDDYDSEYRYAGQPLPVLQGLDQHGHVIFAGSFSKLLFPALRLGYLVVPPEFIDRFLAVISLTRRHLPPLEQAALTEFIADGHLNRHLRRMREIYAHRLGTLLECADELLTGGMEVSRIEAGLQTVGWLRPGFAAEAVARAAARRNVEVTPLNGYWRDEAGRQGLHLGFAAVDAAEIRRGVRELATVLEE